MTKNRFKWSAMTAAFVAASLAGSLAFAANELQENFKNGTCDNSLAPSYLGSYFLGQPQPLQFDSDGIAVMNGTMINGLGNDELHNFECNVHTTDGFGNYRDVDFYSFHANADDVFDFAISNAWDPITQYTWVVLGVYGPPVNGTYPLLRYANYSTYPNGDVDYDTHLDAFHANATGTYYIGVSSRPGDFAGDDGRLLLYQPMQHSPEIGIIGSYTLTVKPAAPTVLPISIEIKPGDHHVTVLDATSVAHPATLRGTASGHLPVALLSGDNFDATKVKQSTLRFGATGKEESLVNCSKGRGIDVNHDGKPDLLCHFDMTKANFALSEVEGKLTGETADGKPFEGTGWLKIVTIGLTPENLGHGHK